MQINRAERLTICFTCWNIGFLQRPLGDKFITLHQRAKFYFLIQKLLRWSSAHWTYGKATLGLHFMGHDFCIYQITFIFLNNI